MSFTAHISKKAVATREFTSPDDLVEVIEDLSDFAGTCYGADRTVVSLDTDATIATLFEETLTDGSKVYNIVLRPSAALAPTP